MNNKIHIVIGTKAQLIKMAPIMHLLEKRSIDYNYIFTGQHKLTMDELRENFKIKKPDIILYKGKDITSIFSSMIWFIKICIKTLVKKKKIFGETKKTDILLTHGDTFSTVLGGFMGKIARIKVAHIESGLRSFKLFSPFPEEINRLLTFRLSDTYFCAGEWAKENLKKYKGKKINTELNTLYDSLNFAIEEQSNIQVDIPKENYILCSIHRFENIFNTKRLKEIINILLEISKSKKILFILHEATRIRLEKTGLIKKFKSSNIELRPRYDYFEFIKLLYHSDFLITDGGSNQEECYYMGKPCLLMRDTTERTEGINENVVISYYDKKVINDFSKNFKKHIIERTNTKLSPSEIIVDEITK